MPQETRDKILEAAMDLMSINGYRATTTKDIANMAGVSEMTLFRKFPCKQDILDALIEKYTYSFTTGEVYIPSKLVYNLEKDLAYVSRAYQQFMNENKKIVLLAYKESGTNDAISARLTANPITLKAFLTDYLTEMKNRDEIIDINLDQTIMAFMQMNLGYFSSKLLSVEKFSTIHADDFIENSVKIFARGLRKER